MSRANHTVTIPLFVGVTVAIAFGLHDMYRGEPVRLPRCLAVVAATANDATQGCHANVFAERLVTTEGVE